MNFVPSSESRVTCQPRCVCVWKWECHWKVCTLMECFEECWGEWEKEESVVSSPDPPRLFLGQVIFSLSLSREREKKTCARLLSARPANHLRNQHFVGYHWWKFDSVSKSPSAGHVFLFQKREIEPFGPAFQEMPTPRFGLSIRTYMRDRTLCEERERERLVLAISLNHWPSTISESCLI